MRWVICDSVKLVRDDIQAILAARLATLHTMKLVRGDDILAILAAHRATLYAVRLVGGDILAILAAHYATLYTIRTGSWLHTRRAGTVHSCYTNTISCFRWVCHNFWVNTGAFWLEKGGNSGGMCGVFG